MYKGNNVFIKFNDFWNALSSNKITRTKKGELNISEDTISINDFNIFYMQDVKLLLSEYERFISPDFSPTKELFKTLDLLSSPVLKETNVPEAVNKFYKKLKQALSSKEEDRAENREKNREIFEKKEDNKQVFESEVRKYVQDEIGKGNDVPVFMLLSMEENLYSKNNTPSPFKDLMPTSSELMNGYGTKYDGEDILNLAKAGYINPEEPIKMLIYESLNLQDETAPNYIQPVSYKSLLDFYAPDENTLYNNSTEIYSPSILHTLLTNKKINENFSNLFEVLISKVSAQEKTNFYKSLIDEESALAHLPTQVSLPIENAITQDSLDNSKNEPNNQSTTKGNISAEKETFSNNILEYANKRILPDSYLAHNIKPDFLINKFNKGEISIFRFFEIYKTDPEYFKDLLKDISKKMQNPKPDIDIGNEDIDPIEELRKRYSNEKAFSDKKSQNPNISTKEEKPVEELMCNLLMQLPKNIKSTYIQSDKANFSTIMYLFLHYDGISITDLQNFISKNNIKESLDYFIDEGSHASRIKELYENYLIDYGCIIALIGEGILKKEDMKEFRKSIPEETVYSAIQNAAIQNSPEIVISGSAGTVVSSNIGSFYINDSANNEIKENVNKVYQILGGFSDTDTKANAKLKIIHHDERNNPGLLNDYNVLPLKPSGLVALIPPIQSENTQMNYPTYLMPAIDFAYILINKRLPDSFQVSPVIKEIKPPVELNKEFAENILRTAYSFDEAKPHLESLGYKKDLTFEELLPLLLKEYEKIRVIGGAS